MFYYTLLRFGFASIILTDEYSTRLDYCQFLLVMQTNYTLRYVADHRQGFSRDAVKRYLEGDNVTARLVWENVRDQVVQNVVCLVFGL